jgi:hypothetical protein
LIIPAKELIGPLVVVGERWRGSEFEFVAQDEDHADQEPSLFGVNSGSVLGAAARIAHATVDMAVIR